MQQRCSISSGVHVLLCTSLFIVAATVAVVIVRKIASANLQSAAAEHAVRNAFVKAVSATRPAPPRSRGAVAKIQTSRAAAKASEEDSAAKEEKSAAAAASFALHRGSSDGIGGTVDSKVLYLAPPAEALAQQLITDVLSLRSGYCLPLLSASFVPAADCDTSILNVLTACRQSSRMAWALARTLSSLELLTNSTFPIIGRSCLVI